MVRKILNGVFLFLMICNLSGCDFIYGLVDKKGAEEKKILGDISPYQTNLKVQDVQQLLKLYGYNPGRIDGVFGQKTREAIGEFQLDAGLDVSSKMDKATWQSLHFFVDIGVVQNHAVDLVLIQQVLQAAKCYSGKIDGKMGPQSQQALMNFQKKNGIKPVNKINYKTLFAMKSYLEW